MNKKDLSIISVALVLYLILMPSHLPLVIIFIIIFLCLNIHLFILKRKLIKLRSNYKELNKQICCADKLYFNTYSLFIEEYNNFINSKKSNNNFYELQKMYLSIKDIVNQFSIY